MQRILALTLLAAVLLLTIACAPSRKACEKNYGPCGIVDTVNTVTERVRTVTIPGAVVEAYIYDTLHTTDTLRITDSAGVATLEWYKAENGRIKARCKANERKVVVIDTLWRTRETRAVLQPCPPPPHNTWYWWFGGGVVIALAAPYLIKWGRMLAPG